MNYKTCKLLITLILISQASICQIDTTAHFLVKLRISDQTQNDLLLSLEPDFASTRIDSFAEIIIDETGLNKLRGHGFESQIVKNLSSMSVAGEYHRYQDVLDLLNQYHNSFPEITHLDTIGTSQRMGLLIPAIKISDNPEIEEDEPAVLYDGLHHAREPVGMECTLEIMKYLLTNYGYDQKVTDWVDNTEIWIVPMINPEGWHYLVENDQGINWWRKNLRENGNNTMINSDYDGVDINRNYDFNWILGGSNNPGSSTFRGPEVFSESEARAKRDLALNQKFIISLSYHSYGQIVIYSWRDFPRAPDQDLIKEIADSIAYRIPKFNEETSYDPSVSDCQNGYSRCWMYARAGTIEYTVETAPSFLPSGEDGIQIARDNLQGGLYILDRIRGSGISGNITDKLSGKPLVADYKVVEIYDDILQIRTSDSLYGRYDRLLQPGTYTLEVSKEGYQTQTITDINVADGIMTELDISLTPVLSGLDEINDFSISDNLGLGQNYPNPFSNYTTIKFYTAKAKKIKIMVYDLLGQEATCLVDKWYDEGLHQINWNGKDESGKRLKSGLYFYNMVSENQTISRKLIIK